MRLYYFTSERYGLEAIRDRRLKIARIASLNDPFEFLGLRLDRVGREVQRKWKKNLGEKFGLICMSTGWGHPLMWSHYGDKHNGICLGFNVTENEKFRRVEYRNERFTLNDFGCQALGELDEEGMLRLLHTKFESWSYEQEYRGFIALDEADPVSDLYFLPFSSDMQLVEVIVGESALVSREKLAKILGNLNSSIKSFKARSGFTKFEVVRNYSESQWT